MKPSFSERYGYLEALFFNSPFLGFALVFNILIHTAFTSGNAGLNIHREFINPGKANMPLIRSSPFSWPPDLIARDLNLQLSPVVCHESLSENPESIILKVTGKEDNIISFCKLICFQNPGIEIESMQGDYNSDLPVSSMQNEDSITPQGTVNITLTFHNNESSEGKKSE
ncbi:MAG: hypothetical protein CVV64_05670 [Candidatus Wallbacteria bacterium HGW-Wallbacteria-1]|jgi:hypothetical protein|uniref:Uncharacterized protein n=1 Tax=Candidatus Wallbacteria bacterium HGW-Wallbacteria-1 TaxID=2013854 RepID=A0A2N1PSD7_9BACT|nr:MAG: hypothetical protein CVV64_05670 [Candidatus Wallbacteria bacterium HGW-Wallbacteria-1]